MATSKLKLPPRKSALAALAASTLALSLVGPAQTAHAYSASENLPESESVITLVEVVDDGAANDEAIVDDETTDNAASDEETEAPIEITVPDGEDLTEPNTDIDLTENLPVTEPTTRPGPAPEFETAPELPTLELEVDEDEEADLGLEEPINILINEGFESEDMEAWVIEILAGDISAEIGAPYGRGVGRGLGDMANPYAGEAALRWWDNPELSFTITQEIEIQVAGLYNFEAFAQGENATHSAWISLGDEIIAELDGQELTGWREWSHLEIAGLEFEVRDLVTVGLRVEGEGNVWGSFDDVALWLVEAHQLDETETTETPDIEDETDGNHNEVVEPENPESEEGGLNQDNEDDDDEDDDDNLTSGDIEVSFEVDPTRGGLSLSFDPELKVHLGSAYLNPDANALVADGYLPEIRVTDTRIINPGWSLTGQASQFVNGEGQDSGAKLGWTPAIVHQSNDAMEVEVGAPIPASDGIHGGATKAVAPAGAGLGTVALDAVLRLQAPTNTPAGSYRASITLTLS